MCALFSFHCPFSFFWTLLFPPFHLLIFSFWPWGKLFLRSACHDFRMKWGLWMEKFFQALSALRLWLTHGSKGRGLNFICTMWVWIFVWNLNISMWPYLNAVTVWCTWVNTVLIITTLSLRMLLSKQLSWILALFLHVSLITLSLFCWTAERS